MTNFPTTLDTFQNPEASTPMDAEGLEHDVQHANLNDAVRALQVKVGADNSGVVTSFDYRLRQLEQGGGGGGFSNPLNETLSIVPANNTSAIHVSGYSLTGGNALPLLDLAGTWNTGGSPTAIKVNITNTASGGNSLFADFQIGGVSKLSIDKFGNLNAGSALAITAGGDLHLTALSHQIYLNAGDAPSSAVNICGNALFMAGYGLVSLAGPTQSLQLQSDGITLFQLMGTWNTTETASGLSFNVIDQASAFDSILLDLQVNGNSVFKVDKRSVASVTYIQNAQEQLLLSGDSGNLYLYYPASGHNAITADDSTQTLSLIETGSDQTRAQLTAYADFVFYDSTNGNQPCFTVRGDGSGVTTNGGSLAFGASGNTFWNANDEETITLQVNSTDKSAIQFLTGDGLSQGAIGIRNRQSMFFHSSSAYPGFSFETGDNNDVVGLIDNLGNVAFSLSPFIDGAFNLLAPYSMTQFKVAWDTGFPRIYLGDPVNGSGNTDAIFTKVSPNGAADFYFGEDADQGGIFLRGQGAFGIGTQAGSLNLGLWLSSVDGNGLRQFGFNTLSPTDVLQVNGMGSGNEEYGQIGWWSMDGSARLGMLQDDGSGTYGMINLFGDSTVNSCICEFDAMDRNPGGGTNFNLRGLQPNVQIHTDLRVFTFTVQTDANAGGYAAAFNPRDGGGGFVNNQLYINASGVGIATSNPLHALDVNGSIGNSNGDISIVGDQTGNNGSNVNISAGDSAGGGGYYTGGNISLTAGGGGTDGGNDGSIFLIAGNRGAGNGNIVLTPAPGGMAQVAGRFRVDDSISAPATNSTPAFTSYYGSNAKALGDPDGWLRINVGGTDYKVPLYS